MTRPVLGQSVHFYNEAYVPATNNSMGAGPYHAIVAQVWPGSGEGDDDPYVNLTVFPPFGNAFHEGSVKRSGQRRYEWPPQN